MEATFPLFLHFPKEIQILIWEAAVRPSGDRHVHRFSIAGFPLRHTNRKHLRLQNTKRLSDGASRLVTCSSLTVSPDDVEGNPNDSIYLSDSGLWTACKNSRDAMEGRFKGNEWWSHIKSPYHPKRTSMPGQCLGREDATHTASYTDHDGVVKHITIGYERDLVHLDSRYLYMIENIDWFHAPNGIFQLPVFDNRRCHEVKPSFVGFVGENIALDYDCSIMDNFYSQKLHYQRKELKASFGEVLDTCCRLLKATQRTVWLVDYGLVPAPNTAAEPTAVREIFRSGDCSYTEVKSEDIGVLWHLVDYDRAYDGENHSAFGLVGIIEQSLFRPDGPSRLRVLACQPAPGRNIRPRNPWAVRCHGHPSCEVCNADKPVPRVRPSTIVRSESSSDLSDSDLNLFD
ncbi:hypothetical protein FVEN_g351 [Fusarium venenatum]|uniref:Uncharacterized protein n=1 Tax=Fusarium venenatum TaxID=56646 RepID=A0A2L2TQK6_9HYPO|nr:uncharacterized protein FVRRES_07536 [Fusarium venenatum]KAG8362463.1 hypothetical protein FVEN_g351 [Fusarium venenatum]KAH6994444.1 hypothetical protein EDB82DRAFT_575891 [Fusarium venenatum]CEI63100.1 unnamed protein product [Fusarium venenatum]